MSKSDGEDYDVAIIGGGPAGMSAALWSAELGIRAVLIEERSELGGQLLYVHNRIENYPGVSAANGRELRDLFVKSLEGRKFDLRLSSPVTATDLTAKKLTLESGEIIHSKSIIIATGVRRRKLNVPGEDEFLGRGILTSGAKEAESVKGKTVLIVGGGDAALENALILSKHANHVTIVHRRKSFSARNEFIRRVETNQRISVRLISQVTRFSGSNRLEQAEIIKGDTNSTSKLDVEAALVRIGVIPISDLFQDQLVLDSQGYIPINSACQTSVEQVYAVGDAARPISQTVANAVGDGTSAAKYLAALKVTRDSFADS